MKVFVLGTGGWGIALAMLLHQNGHEVTSWTYLQEECDLLHRERCNEKLLPGVVIPEGIEITTDMSGAAKADLVVLAGYLPILGRQVVRAYEHRIINIHPSLLPAFRGAHAIEQALEYGVKVFGVTIHYVDGELDGGRIIAQRAFPYEGSDIEELEPMIHAVEYPLYIETIKKLIE
mgnify:CR=1 FL=1